MTEEVGGRRLTALPSYGRKRLIGEQALKPSELRVMLALAEEERTRVRGLRPGTSGYRLSEKAMQVAILTDIITKLNHQLEASQE